MASIDACNNSEITILIRDRLHRAITLTVLNSIVRINVETGTVSMGNQEWNLTKMAEDDRSR